MKKALTGINHLTEQIQYIIPRHYAELIDRQVDIEVCKKLIRERDEKLGELHVELIQLEDYVQQQHQWGARPGRREKAKEREKEHEPEKKQKIDQPPPHDYLVPARDQKLREQDVNDVQRLFARMATRDDEKGKDTKHQQNGKQESKEWKIKEKEIKEKERKEENNSKEIRFTISSMKMDKSEDRAASLKTVGGMVEIVSLQTLLRLSPLIHRLWEQDQKQTVYFVPQVQLLVLPLIAEVVRWFTQTKEMEVKVSGDVFFDVLEVKVSGDVLFNLFLCFYKKRIWTSGCLERYVEAFERAVRYLDMPVCFSDEARFVAEDYIYSSSS